MQTYQRIRRKKVAEINVVPYIDVMLVLLIIFMAVTPVITQGVKVDLPQAESEQLPEDAKPPFIVSVNTEGEYVIKAGEADDEPVPPGSPEAMQQFITEQAMGYLAVNQNAPVVVAGDKSVRYEEVILLMVALKKAGVPQVGLMTDPVN
ncbi:protein TolR [Aeromonas bivalvium]|uniref:Tol-Pal system protein TolR n=1 Tax=Aeromonas bivalvium TaxID=440079 RepID=A0ABW9GUU3_9GAMM|nr:protein TolR [Aeromonas bivalvium]